MGNQFISFASKMHDSHQKKNDEVDQLLLNAQLRDELEPFLDESVDLVDVRRMSTPAENEFLASMLAWEQAPILPISRWFDPELVLPPPDTLGDEELQELLYDTIQNLYDKRIILDFTEHLSDRGLYCLLYRDILPAREKKVDLPKNYLHWHCLDDSDETEIWLRYYATDYERKEWAAENGLRLPASEVPPYPRRMPRRPPTDK